MKKEYRQPRIKVVAVKTHQMLCNSPVTLIYRGYDNYSGEYGIDVE